MRTQDYFALYSRCRLCPRACGIDRMSHDGSGSRGFCGQPARMRVAYVGPHFGEEPPISGKKGSGTVFFSGCSLRCSFCQNHQISRQGMGRIADAGELICEIKDMIRLDGVHNVNFVTPDHFFPHIFQLVSELRKDGLDIPTVYNMSGYQSVDSLRLACDWADIYLPDFKYAQSGLAERLSRCGDYPQAALNAVTEMVNQKGFLDVGASESLTARKGVLVRHLVLPGHEENSMDVLTMLFLEFGKELPLSLMAQYQPVVPQNDPRLNTALTSRAFSRVCEHAMDLGFEQVFIQDPQTECGGSPSFLPDFRKARPFGGRGRDTF